MSSLLLLLIKLIEVREEPEHLAVCVKALSKFGDKLAYFE